MGCHLAADETAGQRERALPTGKEVGRGAGRGLCAPSSRLGNWGAEERDQDCTLLTPLGYQEEGRPNFRDTSGVLRARGQELIPEVAGEVGALGREVSSFQ